MKTCYTCKINKPLSHFHKSKRKCDKGYVSSCADCKNMVNKNNRLRRRKSIKGWIADNLTNSIRARNLKKFGKDSDLTVDYLLELWDNQGGKCYWLNMPMIFDNYSSKEPMQASLDKIEPSLGYMKGNVVFASMFANRARGNCSHDEFRAFLNTIITQKG